jgi:hypothetical protein
MKKITLKISTFLLLTMFALQVQGQALYTVEGTYKISTSGVTPVLYITLNGSTGNLEWAEELPGEDPTQVWTIKNHRTPASAGLMEIWTTIPNVGNFTMATADDSASPSLTLVARAGDPVSVVELSEDYSGLDQFQRRKTPVGPDGLALSSANGGSNPSGGNNAIFLRNTVSTTSRYGVVPSAAGEAVQFDGGGIDVIQYHLVAPLSNEKFDTSSIFISNPVNNELSIKGLTSNVSKVSVFTLLGSEVLTKNIAGKSAISINVSGLAGGMYIVKLQGDNGSFSKKIVKQ